jgi:hypothetical protein
MENRQWLVISYNLPTEPSRHRVTLWRSLKKLGAVNLQQSMWVLPANDINQAALTEMATDIESHEGEALLMACVFLESDHERRVIRDFNLLRDEEYREFIDESEKYLKEIDKEIAKQKFIFAELEEEEAELEKLVSWHAKIALRDLFGAGAKTAAGDLLARIRAAFERYADLVGSHEIKG